MRRASLTTVIAAMAIFLFIASYAKSQTPDWVTKKYFVEFTYDSYDNLYGTGLSSDWDDTVDSPWLVPGFQPMLGIFLTKFQFNFMMTGLARHIKLHTGGKLIVKYDKAQVYSLPDRVHTFDVWFGFEPADIPGNELEDHLGYDMGFTFAAKVASWRDYLRLDKVYSGQWDPSWKKSFTYFDLSANINASGVCSLQNYDNIDGKDIINFIPQPFYVNKGGALKKVSLTIAPRIHDFMKGDEVAGQVNGLPAAYPHATGHFSITEDNNTIDPAGRVTLGVPANYTKDFMNVSIQDFAYLTSIYKNLGLQASVIIFSIKWDPEGYGSRDRLVARCTEPFFSFSFPVSDPPPLPDLKPELWLPYGTYKTYPDDHAFVNEEGTYRIFPRNIGDGALNLVLHEGRVAPTVHLYIDGAKIRDFYFDTQTVPPGELGSPYVFKHTFTQVGYHTIKITTREELEEMNYVNNTTERTFRVYPERGTIWGKVNDLGFDPSLQPNNVFDITLERRHFETGTLATTASKGRTPNPDPRFAYYEIMAPVDVYDIACSASLATNIVPARETGFWHDNESQEVSFDVGHYGTLSGVVRRSDNAHEIEGVTVMANDQQTITNALGQYAFPKLPWGDYTVMAVKETTDTRASEYMTEEDYRSTWEKAVTIPASGAPVVQDFSLVPDTQGPVDCFAQLDGVTTPTNLNVLPFNVSAQDRGYPPYQVGLTIQGDLVHPPIKVDFDGQVSFDISSWSLPSGDCWLEVTFYDHVGNASSPVLLYFVRDVTPIDVSSLVIKINGGDSATNVRLVEVEVSPTPSPETPAAMQVRNEDSPADWSGATLMEYRKSFYWTLSPYPITGTKTVYVRYADAVGNWSAVKSDSIEMDASGAMQINGGAQFTNSSTVTLQFTIEPKVDTYMSETWDLGKSTTTTLYSQAWVANTSILTGLSVYLKREGLPYQQGGFPIEVYFTDSLGGFDLNNTGPYLAKHTFATDDISNNNGAGPAEAAEPYGGQWGTRCEFYKISPALSLSAGQTYYVIVRAAEATTASQMRFGTMMTYGPTLFPDTARRFDGTTWQPLSGSESMDFWLTCRMYGRPFDLSNNGTAWTSISNDISPMNWTLTAGEGLKTVYVRYTNSLSTLIQYFDQIILDTTPPTGEAHITGTQVEGGGDYYYTAVDLALNATDAGAYPSGVKWVKMRWACGIPDYMTLDYETHKHINIDEDGESDIEVVFIDAAGNESTTTTIDFEQHVNGPRVAMDINDGTMYVTDPNLTLHLTATTSNTPSKMYVTCSDETQWEWVDFAPSLAHALPDRDGQYFFDGMFKDPWDNIGYAPRARVVLDRDPPSAEMFSVNASAQYTTQALVNLYSRCSDRSSGVWQFQAAESAEALGGAAWQDFNFTAPFTLSGGADGPRTVFFRVRDRAELVSDTVNDGIILDAQPPVGMISVMGDGYAYETLQVTLLLDAHDVGSAVGGMRLRNIANAWSYPWTDWMPLAAMKTWDLPIGIGYGTQVIVQVEYADLNDNRRICSDSVVYDTWPVLSVTPDGAVTLHPGQPSAQLYIANTGGGRLNWMATTTFTSTVAAISPALWDGDGFLTITALDLSTTRTGTVTVYNLAGGGNHVTDVTIRPTAVVIPPALGVSPAGPFTLDRHTATKSVQVFNTGGGVLRWNVTSDFAPTTLTASPTSHTGNGELTLTALDLATTRTGTVTVHNSDNGADQRLLGVTIRRADDLSTPVLAVAPSSPMVFDHDHRTTAIQVINVGGGVLRWASSHNLTTGVLALEPSACVGDGPLTITALDFITTRTGQVIVRNLQDAANAQSVDAAIRQWPEWALIAEHLLGIRTLSPSERDEADRNGDGRIDVADLLYLLVH